MSEINNPTISNNLNNSDLTDLSFEMVGGPNGEPLLKMSGQYTGPNSVQLKLLSITHETLDFENSTLDSKDFSLSEEINYKNPIVYNFNTNDENDKDPYKYK